MSCQVPLNYPGCVLSDSHGHMLATQLCATAHHKCVCTGLLAVASGVAAWHKANQHNPQNGAPTRLIAGNGTTRQNRKDILIGWMENYPALPATMMHAHTHNTPCGNEYTSARQALCCHQQIVQLVYQTHSLP